MHDTLGICHISTFPPTRCGIAHYTEDLIKAQTKTLCTKLPLVYDQPVDAIGGRVIIVSDEDSYVRAAAHINASPEVDVVSLQHEFGLFGGSAGRYVITLLRGLRKPVITTLHTVRNDMNPEQWGVLGEVAAYSSRLIVTTDDSAARLIRHCRLSSQKIAVIPQGIPDISFTPPESSALRKQIDAPMVFVSAGFLRNTKGYHVALEALADYRRVDAGFKYFILGGLQPQFTADRWYEEELGQTISRLQLDANVIRVNEHLTTESLLRYILASDVGLVTYTEEAQNASGILPLMLGMGRVVIATRFAYARAIQTRIEGLFLAEINDPDNLSQIIIRITEDEELRKSLMVRNYEMTRDWVWSSCATQYRTVFEGAVHRLETG